MKHKLLDKQKLSLILVFASLIAVIILGYITAPDTYKHSGDQDGSTEFVEDNSDIYDDWFEDDWSDDDQNSQVEGDKKDGNSSIVWESDKDKKTATSNSNTSTTKKSTSSTTAKKSTAKTTAKRTSSSTTVKKPSSSNTTKKPGTSGGATVEDNPKPTEPEKKPEENNNNNDNPGTDPVPEDTMKWPDNSYTNLVPKPSRGTVQQAELKDGIFCILMTGADMVDAKTYAASLINAGYTSDITETIENNNYLFGGGSASGSFVVISYQNGQFIIGIEK